MREVRAVRGWAEVDRRLRWRSSLWRLGRWKVGWLLWGRICSRCGSRSRWSSSPLCFLRRNRWIWLPLSLFGCRLFHKALRTFGNPLGGPWLGRGLEGVGWSLGGSRSLCSWGRSFRKGLWRFVCFPCEAEGWLRGTWTFHVFGLGSVRNRRRALEFAH